MKTSVPTGLAGQVTILIERQRTIGFMGKRVAVHAISIPGRDSVEPIRRRHHRFVVGLNTTATRLAERTQMAGRV